MAPVTNDHLIQAVFTAAPENKSRALLILQGKEPEPNPASEEAPLLMGMGEAAKFLGISRATLWRMIRDGRLEKVEIYRNAYRLRRSDILALVRRRSDRGAGFPACASRSPQGSPPVCSQVSVPEVSHG